jgi:uncharacterized protein DUF4339
MAVTQLNPFLDHGDALTVAEWYVKVGDDEPVGPVSANQIARGVKAGKIPEDAEVARMGATYWEEVFESPAVVAALKAL